MAQMTYDFALDKKGVISLIAGSVAIGLLLFLGGLLVGRQWPWTAAAATTSATAENQRAALPTEPALNEEASAPATAGAPMKAKPALPAPPTATAPPPATETQTLPGTAPAKDAAPKIISEAVTDNAAVAESAANEQQSAADPEYVTIQVGVFTDEKVASSLLQQMERKGYRPTFFSGRDAEARQWYAVRIGVYSDKQQAANAAANFTKQEKMKAVVRPVESL